VSRTEYTDLFALIGTTFGVGDGSTTFGLPDLRGRAVAGLDNMGGSSADRVTSGSADSMGGSAGVARVTLDTTELPAHTHSRGGWAGSGDAGKSGGGSGVAVSPDPVTGSRGGDGSHNNMQPTFFLNWIIKA
jgi:microcystin-dependent protein